MFTVAVAVGSYLVGSFPTAYFIAKRARGIDISRNGTGNIGAMNAYEVTGSRVIGISVAAIDILKGLAMTSLGKYMFGLTAGVVAAFFVVLGHNYSIFMKFKGGRGLAASAGSLLIIQPLSVVVYLAVYFSLRAAKLKLYISSVIGILLASIPIFLRSNKTQAFEIFAALLLIAVLSKHLIPLRNELQHGT